MKNQNEMLFPIMTIKELSKELGVDPQTLRDWERYLQSIGITIPRDQNNERYYSEIEIQTFRKIKELRDERIGWKAILKILQEARTRTETATTTEPVSPTLMNHPKAVFTQNQLIELMSEMAFDLQRLKKNNEELKETNQKLVKLIEMMANRQDILESMLKEMVSEQKFIASERSEIKKIIDKTTETIEKKVSETIEKHSETVSRMLEETEERVISRLEKHRKKGLFSRLFGG